MKRFQFLTGFLCGALLFTGFTSVASAASGIMAAISDQPVYVDGQRVYLTAYQIGGNNYVKLRDIGEAVGFNVYWDGTSVQVESDEPYTGVAPADQTAQQVPAAPTELTEEAVQATIKALKAVYPSGTLYPAPYRSTSNGPYGFGASNCAGWALLCSDTVECKKVEKPMPKLPVGTAYWTPKPDFATGCEAWILAGGAHHTAFSYDLTVEQMADWASAMGIESVIIDENTNIHALKNELKWNEAYYKFVK